MPVQTRYENLLAAGVIDPTKVTRVALQNAASVAGMFLTTRVRHRRQTGARSRSSRNESRNGRHDVVSRTLL